MPSSPKGVNYCTAPLENRVHRTLLGLVRSIHGWRKPRLLQQLSCLPNDPINTCPCRRPKIRTSPHSLTTNSRLTEMNGALAASCKTPRRLENHESKKCFREAGPLKLCHRVHLSRLLQGTAQRAEALFRTLLRLETWL